VALGANGAWVTVSSTLDNDKVKFSPDSVIDGDRSGCQWNNGGGWSSGFYATDKNTEYVQIDFAKKTKLTEINIFTLHEDYKHILEPDKNMVSTIGMKEFDVKYYDEIAGKWIIISKENSAKVWTNIRLEKSIETFRISIDVKGTVKGDDYARIVKVEAFGTPVQ
jgi:hypothetical protein